MVSGRSVSAEQNTYGVKPKILIRRRSDRLYFQTAGQRTLERDAAKDCQNTEDAVSFATKSVLTQIEVVISHQGGEREIAVFRSLN